MAEVAQNHGQLLSDIRNTTVESGRGAFWWLGQHTFIVKAGETVIYIDPFCANWESRQTPPLLTATEGGFADLALVTHGHGDHLCPESLAGIAAASETAIFVCPRTEEHRLRKEAGIHPERIRAVSAGDRVQAAGAIVTAIRAKHEEFHEHPELGFPYLGYVVEAGGVTFYHAGDTIMYDGLRATLEPWCPLDAMFLPINGRDADRYLADIIGNFTFQEAAELAGDLNARLAVPSHYDMFIGNQEDPHKFVRFLAAKYPSVPVWVGPAGSRVYFPR